MRNCIFLKFLAIVLCAASLMSLLGGTAGILTLTENDLYDQTVDQLIAQRIQRHAAEFAEQAAYRYADQTLGKCPEQISRYGFKSLMTANYTNFGYTILDADGNVLESLNPELKDLTQTHSFPVTGQYMHLVSLQTESQEKEEAARKRLNSYKDILKDTDGNTVPPEGISVHHVIFTDQNGNVLYEAICNGLTGDSAYYYRDYLLDNGTVDSFAHGYPDHMTSSTGFLFYNPEHQLTYTSILEEQENPFQATVYGVLFHNSTQDFTFRAENPEGIGILSNESGYLVFNAFSAAEAASENAVPVPAQVTEPSPETISEAVTEETVAEETVPEEVLAEEAADSTEIAETEAYAEESYEETEYTEEYHEPSSASADPEEYDANESWNEGVSAEEASSEDSSSGTQKEYIAYVTQEAQNRILYEWMLSKGLIDEEDLPELLPDDIFQEVLVSYEILEPNQAIPQQQTEAPSAQDPADLNEPAEESVPDVSLPVMINGKPLQSYQINQTEYYNEATGEFTTVKYIYLPMPELTAEVYVGPEAIKDVAFYNVLRVLHQYRQYLLPVIGASLLVFVLCVIYLFTAAGRKPKSEEVRAGGINRMPLDFYLVLDFIIGGSILALAGVSVPNLLNSDFALGCSLAAAAAFLCCLIFVGFCFALVAQIKTGGGFWWRQTLSVRVIFLFMRYAEIFCVWLKEKALPALIRLVKKLGQFSLKSFYWLHEHTQKFLFRTGKIMDRFFSLIPLTWQWMVCGIFLLCLILIACNTHSLLLTLICLVAALGIVLYGTHCFGVLLDSTRKMVQGNLETKVDKRLMIGCFWDFAKELNNLADVTNVAAQKQLKSERMKTELITNVSHDIKTPLTSIINYVDLLQKPHTEEEGQAYLDVLDRQSQRLKKLVDDLMDMSKASTGNMDVDIIAVDIVESVNQALGEFSDKLEQAQLYPVFRHSENSVPIVADGKLVWRVLSNLLSNIVKYAMPRTRIYLDLTRMNGKVILSLKNISKDPLNINAEELMERFVRGDISRHTDGSGLGLNIAKSLMELQNGQLQILVDGDLFKVTLIFPDGR